MVEKDIAEVVTVGENPDWVLGMVCVAKMGKIDYPWIIVDFKPVNRYVKRLGYPTKVLAEEVVDIPPGMKYFTVLDRRHGYWQVPLSEKSKKYTCFITPWGLYGFKRNVMGLISSGDEHNLRGDRALEGMENVKKIVEGIVIYVEDLERHLERVTKVLERCKAAGIMLHRKKAQYAQPSVEWCGYTLSEVGYFPREGLVDALTHFPRPVSRTDTRSFCGLVQQLKAFSPDITAMMKPITEIMSPKSVFQWLPAQEEAFRRVIEELQSPRVLVQYRPGAKLTLETDVAQKT